MQSGLNTDEVVEILAKLDPISVLSTCQTTPYLGKVCQKQDVFARLMRIHYPQFPVDPVDLSPHESACLATFVQIDDCRDQLSCKTRSSRI